MSRARLYGWTTLSDDNQIIAPFDSKQEALNDAVDRLGFDKASEVIIAEVFRPDFVDFVDAEELADQASQAFEGVYGVFEEWMFSVCWGNVQEANDELRKSLQSWAKKWIDVTSDWIMANTDSGKTSI